MEEIDTLRLRVAALDELTDTLEAELRKEQAHRVQAELERDIAEKIAVTLISESEAGRIASRLRRRVS